MKSILSLIVLFASFNASASLLTPLNKSDKLAGTTRAIATRLSDNNISTGTTQLSAGYVSNTETFKAAVVQGFQEAYQANTGEAVPANAKLKVTLGKFVDGDAKNGTVYAMTTGIMESNDYYDSQENRDPQARNLWVVLRKLPVSSDTVVGQVVTRVKNDSTDEMVTIRYFLVMNPDQKAVQLFTIQGSM